MDVALLCSPPQLKEERGMTLQEEKQADHEKKREKQRVAVSEEREREGERGVGESLKEAVMAPSIDE